ncbi:hypothetical protein MNV49_006432 [Pseudohyphozyma bogoriensis]|nr:hypothetical protein MNV49_006432 [Pseudohyphozyma bogoriensis]
MECLSSFDLRGTITGVEGGTDIEMKLHWSNWEENEERGGAGPLCRLSNKSAEERRVGEYFTVLCRAFLDAGRKKKVPAKVRQEAVGYFLEAIFQPEILQFEIEHLKVLGKEPVGWVIRRLVDEANEAGKRRDS